MQTVTTKAIAKVAAVATGLAMATSMLALAPMAHAAALTSAQVQSILSLLSSFGADSATIANVNASLTGSAPVMTAPSSSACSITGDLTIGSTGAAVTCLQNTLKAGGYMSGNATGYFGALTKSGVMAWQQAKGISPAAGYFGAKSRAAFGGTMTGPSMTPISGNGLGVMLSADSPNGTVLVANQSIGILGRYVFSNPTAAPINITALSFKRTGVSNDSTMTNVYLYSEGIRITDSAGVSNSSFSFTDPTAIITIPAGGSLPVSVRSDILTGTSGQQIGVSLVSVSSNGTLDSSVSFPINSGLQTISNASLATVDYTINPPTPALTTISPQNDFPVWQDTVSVSVNPVKLSSMKFTNLGSIDASYVINLRLYVDGMQVGSAVPSMNANRSVTFDLTSNPVLLSTQSHVVKVLANITGGASRTIQLSVQRTADAMFVDNQLGQPVTTTYAGLTFSAVTTGLVTISSVNGSSGVSVSLAPNSPNQTVAVGSSNVKFASFNMLASGENVKVTDLFVFASSTASSGALSGVGGLKNGKVFLNGVQVGSTKDIGSLVAGVTDFALGSSLILPAGVTTLVDIYADAKDTGSTNIATGGTVIVTLKAGSSNAQGMVSLNSANVPSAATSGNTITLSSSSLTATKYTGYGSQTVIAGSNNAKIGSFTLSTGSTEGVTVNTINFSLSTANAASLTNVTLKDETTGAILGTVITTPSTSNSYAMNYDIPVSSTKTISIYANILSGVNIGTMQATITTSTTGTGDVTGVSASAASTALQTITVGSGTLVATVGAGDPTSANVVAGSSSVKVGQFNFAAANSGYTVQNVAILVPNAVATSVTNVTVSYKDVNGATQNVTQALQVNAAMPYATATFTGLTMYVPTNDSANLDVTVGTPTIASGATSGSAVNVLLDQGGTSSGNVTFRALNSAGAATTLVGTGATLASNGTFYVFKSIPTFAKQVITDTIPTTGNPIYRFSVKADPAGAVEWAHLKFNVATSSASASQMLTGVYLVDEAAPATNLLDNTTSSATTTGTTINIDLQQNSTQPKFQQIAAGATKTYAVYATVAGFGVTGSTLSISLASDAGFTAPTLAATISAARNTTWSDRSNTSHTITTTDWAGGFLLTNFTSNAQTFSR